ncbi:MAG: DUF3987 domain-containing protein [Balneolaceae bacterium]|nr:DUF3987 domain-containing protein [Balneolaceae bacterium]MCH8548223.1 DUF3987 domain-containing protein [Balneolaceae bacterium]
MNEQHQNYGSLPEPPDSLNETGRKVWLKECATLREENRLTSRATEKLEALSFWEQQKADLLRLLRSPVSGDRKEDSSTHLASLKAVQREIDAARKELGLEERSELHISQTPLIPDEVYRSLPELLAGCCDLIEDARDRDHFLSATVSMISGLLPNVEVDHAEGLFRPGLNMLVVRNDSDSVRIQQKVSDMVKPLRLKLIREGGFPPGAPVADKENLRSPFDLVSFMTECNESAVVNVPLTELYQNSEWDWNEFHTLVERSFYQREFWITKSSASRAVAKPSMSVTLSGTVSDFKELQKHAGSEHISNYALYGFERKQEWVSQKPDRRVRSLNRRIESSGEKLTLLWSLLSSRSEPLYVELTEEQWEMMDETFAEKMEILKELNLSEELQAVNRKAALHCLRLVSLFAVLRLFEESASLVGSEEAIEPAGEDIIAALWMSDTYLKHAIRLYQLFPDQSGEQPGAKGDRYINFLEILPSEFETATAILIADKLDIPARTAKRYLNTLVDEKRLQRQKRGHYKKPG